MISTHTQIWEPLIAFLSAVYYVWKYYQRPKAVVRTARDKVYSIVSAVGESLINISYKHNFVVSAFLGQRLCLPLRIFTTYQEGRSGWSMCSC